MLSAVEIGVLNNVHGRLLRRRDVMPLYERRYKSCRSKFEILTNYENSLGEVVCTSCPSTNVRKLLSVIARPNRGGSNVDDRSGRGEFGNEGERSGVCSCVVRAPTRAR